MRDITRTEVDSMLPPSWPRGHPRLHREVGWLADDSYVGIIILDLTDNDFGYVLLTRSPTECLEVGTSFATVEQARAELMAKRGSFQR
jgi:hypothetical protein